ncbi:hypothetical protein GW17_00010855 [Ensete ventricosum]|nr:hypothetical protein GW17_00010855 [Ensete ventricosum]
MQTARYRAVLSIGIVSAPLPLEIDQEEGEGEEKPGVALLFPRSIRHPRAKNRQRDPSPTGEESPARSVAHGRRIASAIRRPRAISFPCTGRRNVSSRGRRNEMTGAWYSGTDRHSNPCFDDYDAEQIWASGTAKNRSSTIDFDGQRPIEGEKGKKKKKKKKKKKRKRRKKKRKRRKPSAVLAPAPSPPSLARRRRASALACFFSRVRRRNISPRREKRSRQRVVKKARSSFAIAHDFSRSVDESIEVLQDCELLNLYDRPEKLIVTTIAVPPVAVRPSVFVDFGKSRGSKGSRDAFVVAIPVLMAKKLTYPERVSAYNIEKLRQLICNGPDKYPGANFILLGDGTKQ